MLEKDRPIFVNLHEDGSVTQLEIPDLNELLGDRITGFKPDARAFLKLQVLLRDEDVIGRLFYPEHVMGMLEGLVVEGSISVDQAVDFSGIAQETHKAFREETVREARELGIPIPNRSKPSKLQ